MSVSSSFRGPERSSHIHYGRQFGLGTPLTRTTPSAALPWSRTVMPTPKPPVLPPVLIWMLIVMLRLRLQLLLLLLRHRRVPESLKHPCRLSQRSSTHPQYRRGADSPSDIGTENT